MPSIEIIANAAGGSFVEGETDSALKNALDAAGLEAKLTLAKGGDKLIEAAKSSDADIIVAAGGDGTINAVGAVVLESNKTLGVLPLGTLNHFSKDLGIPQDIDAAVAVLTDVQTDLVDVGEVNGRIFLNNSSIGLYPQIVRRREEQQERLGRGKWSAAFFAALRVFKRDPFFRVTFEIDGERSTHKAPFVFVGNNEYAMDLYNIGGRETLQAAKLSVYFLRKGGRWGVIRLVVRTLFGMLETMEEFETLTTEAITIDVRKNKTMVAIDGEVEMMETPLEYKIRPRALKVLVPRSEAK